MSRKEYPIYSGFIKYFPKAIKEVAHLSYIGNEQHSPGEPLHWAKEKSTDEPDALMRHLTDHANGIRFDDDGVRHLAKVAWRALAFLERELEQNHEQLTNLDIKIFDNVRPGEVFKVREIDTYCKSCGADKPGK